MERLVVFGGIYHRSEIWIGSFLETGNQIKAISKIDGMIGGLAAEICV